MLSEQRHEIILQLIKEKGSITVSEIREKFGISESTTRRDLTELDKENKLVKVFGGAVALDNSVITKELSISQKEEVCVEEKIKIAKYAASLIKPNDFVYLDAGTTTEHMIEFLNEGSATYVTNAIQHAKCLAEKGFHVVVIGGELKETTEAIVGSQAIMNVSEYHFTKGFFGTNGISRKNGYTTPDYNEAAVKKMAFMHCQKRYVLADMTKFGNMTSVVFAQFQDATVITNQKPSDTFGDCGNIIEVP